MAMYSPGAKRELTKKKAARLEKVDIPRGLVESKTSSVYPQASRLRRLITFRVLSGQLYRPA